MIWEFCTHIPLLYEACRMTTGSVLEVGCGLCSTPLLHAIVTQSTDNRLLRNLYTLDDNARWLSVLQSRTKNENHEYVHIVDWDKNLDAFAKEKFSVIFIDNGNVNDRELSYQTRFQVMKKLAKSCEIMIVHDLEEMVKYNDDIKFVQWTYENFHYFYKDHHLTPGTLWLSNSLRPEFTMQKRS